MGFEDILNQINEQPKLLLSGDCESLHKMDILKGIVPPTQEYTPCTIYLRFKKELLKDDDGQLLHLDYLMEKFQKEFDMQMAQSEVRKKNSITKWNYIKTIK